MIASSMTKAATGATLALLLLAGLSACGDSGGGGTGWTKEGADEVMVRQDEKDCVAESERYGFLQGSPVATGPGSPSTTAAVRQQGDIYQSCMVAKGYGMGRLPKAGQSGQSQSAPSE
jgi:hypothetical protein